MVIRRMRIAVVGDIGVEEHILIDESPQHHGSSKPLAGEVLRSSRLVGGSAIFAALAVRKCGCRPTVIAAVDDRSADSASVRRYLLRRRLRHVLIAGPEPPRFVALWMRQTRRKFLYRLGKSPVWRHRASLGLNVYDARILFGDASTCVGDRGRDAGAGYPLTILVPNQCAVRRSFLASAMVAKGDGLCLNATEARAITHEQNLRFAVCSLRRALRASSWLRWVVVTCGARGSWLLAAERVRWFPYHGTAARYPLGGGDALAGAMACHLIRGSPLSDALPRALRDVGRLMRAFDPFGSKVLRQAED